MMLATFFTSYSLKWISHIKVNSGREEWENLEFIGSGLVLNILVENDFGRSKIGQNDRNFGK